LINLPPLVKWERKHMGKGEGCNRVVGLTKMYKSSTRNPCLTRHLSCAFFTWTPFVSIYHLIYTLSFSACRPVAVCLLLRRPLPIPLFLIGMSFLSYGLFIYAQFFGNTIRA